MNVQFGQLTFNSQPYEAARLQAHQSFEATGLSPDMMDAGAALIKDTVDWLGKRGFDVDLQPDADGVTVALKPQGSDQALASESISGTTRNTPLSLAHALDRCGDKLRYVMQDLGGKLGDVRSEALTQYETTPWKG